MKLQNKIYKVLIVICLITLAIVVIHLGIKLFFWLLYLVLKYPLITLITFVLFGSLLYIYKQFKTK
jgi:hypothetical protein